MYKEESWEVGITDLANDGILDGVLVGGNETIIDGRRLGINDDDEMSVGSLDCIKDCAELYSAVEGAVGDDDDGRFTDGKVGIFDVAGKITSFTVGTDVEGRKLADSEGKVLGALYVVSLGTVECTIVGHVEVEVLGANVDLTTLGACDDKAIGPEDIKSVGFIDGKLLIVVDGNIV